MQLILPEPWAQSWNGCHLLHICRMPCLVNTATRKDGNVGEVQYKESGFSPAANLLLSLCLLIIPVPCTARGGRVPKAPHVQGHEPRGMVTQKKEQRALACHCCRTLLSKATFTAKIAWHVGLSAVQFRATSTRPLLLQGASAAGQCYDLQRPGATRAAPRIEHR